MIMIIIPVGIRWSSKNSLTPNCHGKRVHCRILWKLDRTSLLAAARLVSKRWNFLVSEAVNLKFNCDLTDATMKTVVNSTQIKSRLRIHDFQGTNGNVVSATRGTGPVFRCAEAIHLIGHNINTIELQKMMKYGVGSVSELSFENCSSAIMKSVISLKNPFIFLKCLRMSTTSTSRCLCPSEADTRFLQRLDTPQAVQKLPHLQHFFMSYSPDRSDVNKRILQKSCIKRHLILYRFLIRFHRALKNVQIQRNAECRHAWGRIDQEFRGPERQLNQLRECRAQLGSIQLESLHVGIFCDRNEFSPWPFERSLIQEQHGLKELMVNSCALENPPPTVFPLLIPRNSRELTSLKIITRHLRLEFGHENQAVDLSILSHFSRLKTLEIRFNATFLIIRTDTKCAMQTFRNIERLPISITHLNLKERQLPNASGLLNLVSKRGVRWIIDNLKGLRSLQLQLITCEQAGYGVYQRERFYQVINIDPHTFQDLVSMSNLEEMSIDIMGLNFELENDSQDFEIFVYLKSVTSDEVQVYGGICEQHPRTRFALIENDPRFNNVSYIQISKN